jgi:hypothetical protein
MGDLPARAWVHKEGTVPAIGLGPFRRFAAGSLGAIVVKPPARMLSGVGREV